MSTISNLLYSESYAKVRHALSSCVGICNNYFALKTLISSVATKLFCTSITYFPALPESMA